MTGETLFADAQAQAAELAALRKDAERYRWLRARLQGSGRDQVAALGAVLRENAAEMDAAIDEARHADARAAVGAA